MSNRQYTLQYLCMFNLIPQRSYVVEGSELLLSKDFPQVDIFDQLFLDANSLDIKTLRAQISQFQQTPSGDLRLLIINNSHSLSELLQNTLLKIVEEPPAKGVIMLQVTSKESLLPTLRSRLQRIFRKNAPRTIERKELRISELFSLDRSKIVIELESVMRSLDIARGGDIYRHNVLDKTIRKIKANVNSKLALDWLDLNWRPLSGKE